MESIIQFMKNIRKQREVIFIVDNVRSRHNVGSIFRTADGLGVAKVWLTGITPIPPHPEISKTALGAEDTVEWEKSWELGVVLAELRAQGGVVVGAEKTATSVDMREFFWPPRVALLFGPEVEGSDAKVLELCDAVVHVPMLGMKTSLNVSVAAGVLGYWAKFC